MLGLAAAASAIVVAFDVSHLHTLDTGTRVARDASEHRLGVVGLVQAVALIGCVAAFLLWFSHSYAALPQRRWRSGWAVWSWFIPILNLFRPKQIANDLWRAGGSEDVSPLLHWWWAVWLLSNFLTNSAFRLGIDANTVKEMRAATQMDLAASLATIVAAVLAIAVVRSTTRRLEPAR